MLLAAAPTAKAGVQPMYDERIRSPRWLVLAVLIGVVAVAAVVAAGLLRGDTAGVGLVLGIGAALAGGALMIWVISTFTDLHVQIVDQALRVRFGPFGPTLAGSTILEARPEPYRWVRFGGWGLRGALPNPLRDRAYSVPFVGECVVVSTISGTNYHISSQHPEELAAAIRGIGQQHGAAAPNEE